MKPFLLFSFLLTALVVSAQTSFAPLGAKWYYSASAQGRGPTNSEYYLYESAKDTVLDGHLAKKISVSYFKVNGTTTYPDPIFTYDAGDTVFYYNKLYTKFLPLYIFNVKKGDTITYHVPYPASQSTKTTFRVLVDSVYNYSASLPLKTIKTRPLDDFSFWGVYVQKLGGHNALLHELRSALPEADGPLRCYQDGLIQINVGSVACDYRFLLETGLENPYSTSSLSIFPNPATTQLNIQTMAAYPIEYIIHNTLGQTLLSGMLQKDESISIEGLKEGLYHVEFSNGSWSQRKSFRK